MGLKKNLITRDSIHHPDAYLRITEVRLSYTNNEARFRIVVHHNKAARDANKSPIRSSIPSVIIVRDVDFKEYLAFTENHHV